MISAPHVYQLRLALDAVPDAPAERIAAKREAAVIRRLVNQAHGRFTVRAFADGVAKLGGFLGRKGDSAPGARILWRGCLRLQDMLAALELFEDSREQRFERRLVARTEESRHAIKIPCDGRQRRTRRCTSS